MGLDLISKGLSPFVDHYSYTFSGQPIAGTPYLFQTTLALFVLTFGELAGHQMLRLFAFSLLLFALYKFFKQIKAPWPIIVLILPFIVFFVQMRILVRPELFDLSFIVFALILYVKAKESFSNKNLSYIALLLLFWTNYHVPILGYILFFGLFLDKAIAIISKQEKTLSWKYWLGWGAIIFLVGFLNPDFKHCFFSLLNNSSPWNELITEHSSIHQLGHYKHLYVFWLISIYLIFILLKQKEYGFAFICALFAFQSWEMFRLVTIFGLITFSILAYSLTLINFTQFFSHTKKSIKRLLLFAWFTAISFGIIMSIQMSIANTYAKKYPESIVQYLKNTYPQGGNIFHTYDIGGYLAYKLAPEFKNYIDGRSNILYSFEFTKELVDMFKNVSSLLLSEKIEKYNIEYAVIPLNSMNFLFIQRTKKMGVDFIGDEFILLSTHQNNFPISTALLLFPMCWDEKYVSAITPETIKGGKILSKNSTLMPVLKSLKKLNKENYKAFFNTFDIKQGSNEYRRLFAFIALKSGLYDDAFKLFESILSDKEYIDLFMMIYASIKKEDYSKAEKLLLITSETWPKITNTNTTIDEKALIITLYEKLKKNHTLEENSQQYLVRLREELKQQHYPNQLPLLNITSSPYCNELFSEFSTP